MESSTTKHTSPAISDATSELIVILNPHNVDASKFIGSRAMLETEGLIPDEAKWPAGYDVSCWKMGKFNYRLRRQRPNGAKGPRRDFMCCDWWCLRQDPINPRTDEEIDIAAKTKALQKAIYLRSAKGRAEWEKNWNRYRETTKDDAFQAFKELVPGLIPPKRGRRAKASK